MEVIGVKQEIIEKITVINSSMGEVDIALQKRLDELINQGFEIVDYKIDVDPLALRHVASIKYNYSREVF